ncbi:MAG TPA: carboxypeptidase regulatory-like domain-containing protein [Candidatus Hydrogenedentes bacterium]|nr:carboxypeptidase regulatory-like domain-containing protein [Candidatus Hydrogenedentota bacterium]HOL77897.1 carboxypeptidase regulatory-like domain-containing protein [Candidatus Hydrogenedentota bacterium]HPO87133.1 carboxypeptidase regulatory-like domain-containing protein [Candidatus Hydrogenedentota bacterium]
MVHVRSLFYIGLVVAGIPYAASALDLHGAVVDVGGKPISEAVVWLAQGHDVSKTVSDVQGSFAFSGVRNVFSSLVVMKEGYSLGGVSGYVLGPDTIRVVLGEPGVLSLRLIDHLYKPVEGAAVIELTLMDACVIPVVDLEEQGFPVVRSDANGLLAIPALPKGGFVGFQVSHLRYADTRIPYLPVDERIYPIQLYPGIAVRGRVTDEAGKGVARAEVVFWDITQETPRKFKEVFSDNEGFYKVNLKPSEYSVNAHHNDFAPSSSHRLSLLAKTDQENVNLVLRKAHIIKGKVVGKNNAPFPGVKISYLMEGFSVEDTMTDYEGNYVLKVPKGDGNVHVVPPDGFMLEVPFDVRVTIIDVPETDVGETRVVPIPKITGIVRDEKGEPAPKVLISSLNLTPPLWTFTDDEGQFNVFIRRVPDDGKVSFRAEHRLRFLRADFTADFRKMKMLEVKIRPFDPDLRPNDPSRASNNLDSLVDKPAPELACQKWFNSEPITIEGLRGKVIVLTLWGGFATMGPARDRIEELRALYDLFRGVDDVIFLGVHDSGVEPELAQKYILEYRVTFPVGFDMDTAETFDRYCTNVIPQTVLIDKKGHLRFYDVDGRLLELIKSLCRES